MQTKRILAVLAAVLAVLARGDRVGADGPPKYDLGKKDSWKVGDIVTETIGQSEDQGFTSAMPGGAAPQKLTRASKTAVVMIRKCLEAGADGGLEKCVVFLKKWSFDNGHGADTSLEGAFVEAKGRAKDRTWRLLAAPSPPSEMAKIWLEGAFGPRLSEADSARRMWLPKGPVAVGEEWVADLSTFLDAKFAGQQVDRTRVTSKARLQSVEEQTAKIACEARIPLAGLPSTKKGADPLPWTKGGVCAVTGEITVKLDARLGGGAWRKQSLEGEAGTDGKVFGVLSTSEWRQETQIGGVMPEPPKETAPVEPPGMDAGTK